MLIPMIFLPLLTSIIVAITGRNIGVRGTNILVISTLIISALLSFLLAYEVVLTGSPISITLATWLETGQNNITWAFTIDPLNAWLITTVLFISLLVHIFASSYMAGDPNPQKFMSMLLGFTGFMVLLIAGDNLAVLFVGWEGIGITSYLLIGYWFDRALACSAAAQAIIVNRVGDTMLTLALIILLCYSTGSLDLQDINLSYYLSQVSGTSYGLIIQYTGLFLVLAAAGKSAQFLLHTWLPNATIGINSYSSSNSLN
jgi:NADH:ubiquinone oxidoreductase subunit 5 (subunit L)/multisubunit Na+/H+ antiporter MnhA subunit